MGFLNFINDNIVNPMRNFFGLNSTEYQNTLSGRIDDKINDIKKDAYENITKPVMKETEPIVNAIGIKTPL